MTLPARLAVGRFRRRVMKRLALPGFMGPSVAGPSCGKQIANRQADTVEFLEPVDLGARWPMHRAPTLGRRPPSDGAETPRPAPRVCQLVAFFPRLLLTAGGGSLSATQVQSPARVGTIHFPAGFSYAQRQPWYLLALVRPVGGLRLSGLRRGSQADRFGKAWFGIAARARGFYGRVGGRAAVGRASDAGGL